MTGSSRSPVKVSKHGLNVPGKAASSLSNPFDSDEELKTKQTLQPSRATLSEPSLADKNSGSNPFDDNDVGGEKAATSLYPPNSAAQSRYKNGFRDSGGIENQSVQELENYAVYKAEETTSAVDNCLKIAEEIRGDATKTLVNLHQQGQQITRAHETAASMDHDLSRGEKLLGSLGGMFSRTWKPKKTRDISGPVIFRDDSPKRRGNHLEQRDKLGLNSAPRGQSRTRTPPAEHPNNALQKVEFEKAKQDDALDDLSGLLGDLKNMAIDMGSEIGRQNKGLEALQDDVEEINYRVKGANQRARRLLGK